MSEGEADLGDDARSVVERLGLLAHPEGGFYRETFRATSSVRAPQGDRAASTAIYYLLPAGSFSALHRVRSDEVWHHYAGAPLELHTLGERGQHTVVRLGRDLAAGERPQHVVVSGAWQAAAPAGPGFSLCGCTVAPGFDFVDFELLSRGELARLFPRHAKLLARFTRS